VKRAACAREVAVFRLGRRSISYATVRRNDASSPNCFTRNSPVKQSVATPAEEVPVECGKRSPVISPPEHAPFEQAAFAHGFLLAALIGQGHFGGDGRQPQVTLKLHVRHENLLRYLMTICDGGRLYGPYHHGDRHYYQLMYRGTALRDHLMPLLDRLPWSDIDPHSFNRYLTMKLRYTKFLAQAADADAVT
jgi:hypothetical protein